MPHGRLSAFSFFVALAIVAAAIPTSPLFASREPDAGQSDGHARNVNPITDPAPRRFHGKDGKYFGPQRVFKDNGDGTVTDLKTGLVWEQSDAQNNVLRTWQQAVDYCAELNLGGKTDWRLPSRTELLSIVDYSRINPAIDTIYFPNCRSYFYWSGTTVADGPSLAWYVYFGNGYDYWGHKDYNDYVRCVRGRPEDALSQQ
jgi:hypothetical protein